MSPMVETMAYAKVRPPWHHLGVPVEHDLSPEQMLKKAGLDWQVVYRPGYFTWLDEKEEMISRELGRGALVRASDGRVLSNQVTADWKIVQNHDAATFFCEMVEEGHMNMESAGSLNNGQTVWFLAKITEEGFDVYPDKDRIDAYLCFCNPHEFGRSTSVHFTPVRVECMNTLMMSLSQARNSDRIVRVHHKREFIASEVKDILGISKRKMADFKERAKFLASKPAKKVDWVEYFKKMLPSASTDPLKRDELSRSASRCVALVDEQYGADLMGHSWWAVYNAFSQWTDHEANRSFDTRMASSWFGENRKKKAQAFNLALEEATRT